MIASTDYMKMFADQVRGMLPTHHFHALGADGFGRSDTREKLRGFFEVDRNYVAVAALKALADMELVPRKKVTEAIMTSTPSETLSPILTFNSLTTPDIGAGTSIVALSDSSVINGSSAATLSPGATRISITGMFL